MVAVAAFQSAQPAAVDYWRQNCLAAPQLHAPT
jgi:hypothetical protein